MKRQLVAFFCFLAISAGVAAWTRPGPLPTRIVEGVNMERLATAWRVASIGPKSAFVPFDEGGTGQRANVDMFALQVRSVSGACAAGGWADIEWHWGEQDLVRGFLETRKRQELANADARLFAQPGYTPTFIPFLQ